MRICTFPFKYIDTKGETRTIFVDESDYCKYISGEKTLTEAFGHYINSEIIKEISNYECNR